MDDTTETLQIVDDETVMFRRPRRPFDYAQSKRQLLCFALLLTIAGLAIFCCGLAGFAILPYFKSRQSFQIENKWTVVVAIFGGFSAFGLIFRQSVTFLTATYVCCVTAIPMSFGMSIIHGVNIAFRQKDHETFATAVNIQDKTTLLHITRTVLKINISLCALGIICGICAILLLRFCLQVISRNYGLKLRVIKHRFRLSMVGLAILILGLLVTGWWIGVEALFKGQNLNFHALPTGEILCHGMIIACAGYLQMVATSKGSQPALLAATVLGGVAFILSCYFASYPISTLYLVMQYSSSTSGGSPVFESKTAFCLLLIIVYIALVVLTLYSFLRFLRIVSQDILPNYDDVDALGQPKTHRMLMALTLALPVTGLTYACVEVLAISVFFLYKLDFNSLPIMVVCAGAMLFTGVRTGQPATFAATLPVLGLGISLATRDVYLFCYHVFGNHTPDAVMAKPMDMTNFGFHFAQVTLAVIQIILCIIAFFIIIRLIKRSIAVDLIQVQSRPDRMKRSSKLRFWICALQTGFSSVILVCGFKLLLGQSLYMEDFGDRVITYSLLLLITGIIGIMARKYPFLELVTCMFQVVTWGLIWQESDRLGYLIHNFSQDILGDGLEASYYSGGPYKTAKGLLDNVQFGFASVALLFLLICIILGFCYLILSGNYLEFCTFTKCGTTQDALQALDECFRDPDLNLNQSIQNNLQRSRELVDLSDSKDNIAG